MGMFGSQVVDELARTGGIEITQRLGIEKAVGERGCHVIYHFCLILADESCGIHVVQAAEFAIEPRIGDGSYSFGNTDETTMVGV